jgi:hypothetical protein
VSFTHRWNMSLSKDTGGALSGNSTEVGAAQGSVNTTFPAGTVNQAITLAFTTANIQSIYMLSTKGHTIKTNGTNVADVQTLTITGTPTGGTFTMGFGGVITAPIAFNAAASAVQTALQALSTIGSGNITCTGGPLPGTPVVCTFAGTKTPGYQPPLVTNGAGGLTGGTTPTSAVAHTTPGKPTDTIVLQPGIPYRWGRSDAYAASLFTQDVTTAFVSCTPSSRLQIETLTQ